MHLTSVQVHTFQIYRVLNLIDFQFIIEMSTLLALQSQVSFLDLAADRLKDDHDAFCGLVMPPSHFNS